MASSLLNKLADKPRCRVSTQQPFEAKPRRVETPVASERIPPVEEAVTLDRIANFMELDLRRALVWLKSGLKLALALSLCGAIGAVVWGKTATPRFTVTTDILVNPSNLQVVSNDPLATPSEVNGQLLNFGSRVRILTSGNVLLRAVKDLKLADDPEFYKPAGPGLLSFLRQEKAAKPNPDTAALKTLQTKVGISADEKSLIASLSVSAQTTDKAIAISKAIVGSFQEELATADAENANRAARSLEDRLGELKRDVLAADARVEDYRRAHNLSAGADGRLVTAQTVSQLNNELLAARSRSTNAQLSYDALMKAGNAPLGAQAAVSPALAQLQQTAGLMQQQYDDQAAVLGARHPSILRLKARLSSIRQQIAAELERARNTARVELDKANAAVADLSARMRDTEGSAFDDNQSQVELRELQRDATAKAAIYESFLTRTRQITEREQINTNNVRVITEPLPPSGRAWPPGSATLLLLGAVAGFMIGIGLALVRGLVADLRSAPGTPLRTS
ncbi:MAG: GumC family protein [Shinella zoogloeoides]|uniref:GumC family protein n=1 Tax=Shinella zoogloeoides TaxID=352475 RepID=UPI003C7293A3